MNERITMREEPSCIELYSPVLMESSLKDLTTRRWTLCRPATRTAFNLFTICLQLHLEFKDCTDQCGTSFFSFLTERYYRPYGPQVYPDLKHQESHYNRIRVLRLTLWRMASVNKFKSHRAREFLFCRVCSTLPAFLLFRRDYHSTLSIAGAG